MHRSNLCTAATTNGGADRLQPKSTPGIRRPSKKCLRLNQLLVVSPKAVWYQVPTAGQHQSHRGFQRSTVCTTGGASDRIPLSSGARQGCVLSLFLCVTCMDQIMKETNLCPKECNDHLFPDDQVITHVHLLYAIS